MQVGAKEETKEEINEEMKEEMKEDMKNEMKEEMRGELKAELAEQKDGHEERKGKLAPEKKEDGTNAKREAVKQFKQKLEENLRKGILDSGTDGRSKRRAAAVADERVKEQMDMERGTIRVKKDVEQSSASRGSNSKGSREDKPQEEAVALHKHVKKERLSRAPVRSKVVKSSNKSSKSKVNGMAEQQDVEHAASSSMEKDRSSSDSQRGAPCIESKVPEPPAEQTRERNAESAGQETVRILAPGVRQEAMLTEQAPPSTSSHVSDDALGGIVALASSAGRLPKRLGNCAFDSASRNWIPKGSLGHVPKARRASLLTGFSHQAEKARSSASACKRCGDKIQKATTRVGYPVKDHRGEYGAIVNWFHVTCARNDEVLVAYAKIGETRLRKVVLGYDAMPKEERTKFREDLLRSPDADEARAEAELERPPAVQEVRRLPQHEPPRALKVPMLAFQAEGLGWMLAREADGTTRGGILADEMGMGKTLQTISLLLAGEIKGPTLVVCPAAAMLQWRNEVLRFTEPRALEVRLYYGADRKSGLEDLMGESALLRRVVVLTTYQTLENEYRREVNRTKVQCEWCGRMFVKEKLVYHQKYFCGPDAQRTEKQQKTQLKSEAVKKMKIGGTETEIVLNPLNAIRSAATQALRRRAVGKRPEQTAPMAMPFPVSVLPEEAQAALGYGGGSSSSSQAMPPGGAKVQAGIEEASEKNAAGTPPSQMRKRRRISSKGSAEDVQAAPAEGAASKEGKAGSGDGGGADAGASCGMHASPTSTPGPVSAPRKRWAKASLDGKAVDSGSDFAASVSAATSKSIGLGWGTALQTRRAAPAAVIELSLSDDDGSDLELLREVGGASDGGGLAFAAPSSSSSSSVPVKPPHRKSAGSVVKEEPPEADAGEPVPPDSDDEDEGGSKIDLSRSPLFRTQWGRIVLDEAHRIKSRTNSTAQAAFALRCCGSRWCLSGTPLQNRVGDFWSIIRFVRFYPYAHYMCSRKGCSCVSLCYRFDPETSLCQKCGHTKMQHRSHFATVVSNPIKKFGFLGAGKVAMEKLRSEVLDRILLRRTKVERAADVKLPALEVRIRKDPLSPQEKDFYTSMYTQGRTQFDTYVEGGTLLHNYAHVFDLIMRLRQAVDHPYLIVHGSLKAADPTVGLMPSKSRGNSDVCALCQDDIEDRAQRARATCGHSFHRDCLTEYLEQAPQLPSGGVGCPSCFLPMTWAEGDAAGDEEDDEDVVDDALEEEQLGGPADTPEKSTTLRGRGRNAGGKFAMSIMQKIKTSEFQSSTKIEALVQEIKRMSAADSTSKALVFSQFTRFLELIEWRLKREGISAATVLGSMSIVSRNNIIVSFQTEPTLQVLLISLKAGGEGLNLQAADHIFIMDPWWNPAAEQQAIQRAHRIGQLRPVKATRFVAADTIEEKIIELQEKKQSVFDCTVGNSNQALQRLSAEDIQFLFSN